MEIEISLPDTVNVFSREIQNRPQKIFELIRFDVRETIGRYLATMMDH
jgi:putative transposase